MVARDTLALQLVGNQGRRFATALLAWTIPLALAARLLQCPCYLRQAASRSLINRAVA
jgi:hypothetical protein